MVTRRFLLAGALLLAVLALGCSPLATGEHLMVEVVQGGVQITPTGGTNPINVSKGKHEVDLGSTINLIGTGIAKVTLFNGSAKQAQFVLRNQASAQYQKANGAEQASQGTISIEGGSAEIWIDNANISLEVRGFRGADNQKSTQKVMIPNRGDQIPPYLHLHTSVHHFITEESPVKTIHFIKAWNQGPKVAVKFEQDMNQCGPPTSDATTDSIPPGTAVTSCDQKPVPIMLSSVGTRISTLSRRAFEGADAQATEIIYGE